jgi:hypothetical protein
MKYLLGLFFACLLLSCSTQAPNEDEVKQVAQQWYMQQNQRDGAGQWDVKGITVLSVNKDAEKKDIFNTISLVTGNYLSPAVAEPNPERTFTDTLRMDLRWNGVRWVTGE